MKYRRDRVRDVIVAQNGNDKSTEREVSERWFISDHIIECLCANPL